MVINIAAFVDDPIIKNDLLFYSGLRSFTLDLCFSLPGYNDLKLKEKNNIYDMVRNEIEKSLNGSKK